MILISTRWTPVAAGDAATAVLRVHANQRAAYPIPRFITGKFAEHLGHNIYNGMSAQILQNPTLAAFPFWNGQTTPDGVAAFQSDRDKILPDLRRQARNQGWPDTELDRLVESYQDGLAGGWTRLGLHDQVSVSPDTGPYGGRAQRIEVKHSAGGIAQWTWLPLHRVRQYDFEIMARSPDLTQLTVSLVTGQSTGAVGRVTGIGNAWRLVHGRLELGPDAPADAPYRFALMSDRPGQIVVERILLLPADHVQGADPDVIRWLKESRLPILRWPGGNYVSAYHWQDGVGPAERRPTRPNYGWGGVEPNLFGTDEFIAFCRAVGCEPMICVNAGNGTPEEAARWIQYCNGSARTPMGKLRAANGHPKPFGVRYWEVGNELWGRWQVHWTTAPGYVDRYRQFAGAMQAADPAIQLYACGAPVFWGKSWNDTLIAGASPLLTATTDHPLIGGDVSPDTDPLDVYRDFMGVPQVLEQKWKALGADMDRAGIRHPRLAVTELQLFAHLSGNAPANRPVRLTRENLVNPGTLAEGLYDVLIYHAAVRLAPFVTMVTHSATVNHGGGLRKERERVFANPCYYAQAAFADFAQATPVGLDLQAPEIIAPRVLSDFRGATAHCAYPALDALAALAANGDLLLSLVQRGTAGPLTVQVQIDGFPAALTATMRLLTSDVPWAGNTRQAPAAVTPVDSIIAVAGGQMEVTLPPFSVARIRVPRTSSPSPQ